VDKKCTDTQRLFGACGKCTKFVCKKLMWDFNQTVMVKAVVLKLWYAYH